MNDQEALTRASKARTELTLSGEYFDRLETEIYDRWASTGIDADAHREKLFHAVSAVRAVRKALMEAVQAGEMVKHSAAMAELLAPPRPHH